MVVKSEKVVAEKITGTSAPVLLLDRTVRYLPKVIIYIKTTYFNRQYLAKWVSNLVYGLISANMPLVRGSDDPDTN